MRKSFSIALCALLIALCSTGCSLRRKSMSGAAEADLLTSAEVAGFMDRRKPAEPFTANGSVTLRRNGEEISSRIVLYYAPDGGMVITVRPVVFFEALRIGITSEGITVIDYYGKGYLRLSEAEASRLLGVPFRSALWTELFFGLPLSGDTHKTRSHPQLLISSLRAKQPLVRYRLPLPRLRMPTGFRYFIRTDLPRSPWAMCLKRCKWSYFTGMHPWARCSLSPMRHAKAELRHCPPLHDPRDLPFLKQTIYSDCFPN